MDVVQLPEPSERVPEATVDELKRGWLWGPVAPADLPNHAVVTRRFGIWQRSGDNVKCRPIDSYKESLVNLTTPANETITLHSTETIAAGISLAMQHAKDTGCRVPLLMKSYDLTKAYKNVPIHPDSLSESFLCVYDPKDRTSKVFGQYVMPFGARSSVHGFVRVSAAMWMVGVSLLHLHWYSYCDDFPVIETGPSCPIAQMAIDFLFNLLGWEVSSDKDHDFSSLAKVLGIEYDLRETKLGLLVLRNTAKRVEDVSADCQGFDGSLAQAVWIFRVQGMSLKEHMFDRQKDAVSQVAIDGAACCQASRNMPIPACISFPGRILTNIRKQFITLLLQEVHLLNTRIGKLLMAQVPQDCQVQDFVNPRVIGQALQLKRLRRPWLEARRPSSLLPNLCRLQLPLRVSQALSLCLPSQKWQRLGRSEAGKLPIARDVAHLRRRMSRGGT